MNAILELRDRKAIELQRATELLDAIIRLELALDQIKSAGFEPEFRTWSGGGFQIVITVQEDGQDLRPVVSGDSGISSVNVSYWDTKSLDRFRLHDFTPRGFGPIDAAPRQPSSDPIDPPASDDDAVPADEPRADEPATESHASPKREEPTPDLDSPAPVAAVVPEERAAATPVSSTPPGLITGPWSEDDQKVLIDMVLEGHGPTAIAAALSRKQKDVANRKYRMKTEIADARKARRDAKRGAQKDKPAKTFNWSKRLDALEQTDFWTPERDVQFVSHIAKGAGVAGAGAMLKIGSEDARVRWKAITGSATLTPGNQIASLLEALTERAANQKSKEK